MFWLFNYPVAHHAIKLSNDNIQKLKAKLSIDNATTTNSFRMALAEGNTIDTLSFIHDINTV